MVAPTIPDDLTNATQDTVEAFLKVDSPVDLGAIDWSASLHYVSGVDPDGNPLVVVDDADNPTIVVDFTPEIEQYPNQDPQTPSLPYTASGGGTFDAVVSLTRLGGDGASEATGNAIVTVKDATGVVAQQSMPLDLRLLPVDDTGRRLGLRADQRHRLLDRRDRPRRG